MTNGDDMFVPDFTAQVMPVSCKFLTITRKQLAMYKNSKMATPAAVLGTASGTRSATRSREASVDAGLGLTADWKSQIGAVAKKKGAKGADI